MSYVDKTATIDLIFTYIAGILMGLLLALMIRAAQITEQYDHAEEDAIETDIQNPSEISSDNQ